MKIKSLKRISALVLALMLLISYAPISIVKAIESTTFSITFSEASNNRDVSYSISQEGNDGLTENVDLTRSEDFVVNNDGDIVVTVSASTTESNYDVVAPDGWTEEEGKYVYTVSYSDIEQGLSINANDFFSLNTISTNAIVSLSGNGVVKNGEEIIDENSNVNVTDVNKEFTFIPTPRNYVAGIKVDGTDLDISDVAINNDGSISYTIPDLTVDEYSIDIAFRPVSIPNVYTSITDLGISNNASVYNSNNTDYVKSTVALSGRYSKLDSNYLFDDDTRIASDYNSVLYKLDTAATTFDSVISAYKINVEMDSTAPNVSTEKNGNPITSVLSYVKASDDIYSTDLYFTDGVGAGISEIGYSRNNNSSVDWQDLEIVSLDSNGKGTIIADLADDEDEATYYVYTRDNIGNDNSSNPVAVTIRKDANVPVVTSNWETANNNNVFEFVRNIVSKNKVLTFTASEPDNESGVANIVVHYGRRQYTPEGGSNTVTIGNLNENQVNNLTIDVVDKVGNAATISYAATLDTEAPMVETNIASYHRQADTDVYFTKGVENGIAGKMQLKLSDVTSGIQHVSVKNEADNTIASYNYSSGDILRNVNFDQESGDCALIDLSLLTDEDNNGIYTAYITGEDIVGNKCNRVVSIVTDKASPIIDGDVTSTKPTSYRGSIRYGETVVYQVDNVMDAGTAVPNEYAQNNASGVRDVKYTLVGNMNGESANHIVIPDGFKGYVKVTSTDNVGNEKTVYSRNIVCTSTNNGQANVTSDSTNIYDDKGNPLYNNVPNVTLDAVDEFAYIQKIEYSVEAPYDEQSNVATTVIYAADNNAVDHKTVTVPVDVDSDDVVIKFYVTDSCGNVKEYSKTISIDKTAPAIEVSYDNNMVDSGNRYNASRLATIKVIDSNFDANDFVISISNSRGNVPSISGWTSFVDAANNKNNMHIATVLFDADGDYSMDMSYIDKAGNAGNVVGTQIFTIDKTAPGVSISFNNNNSLHDSYYATGRVATITINEHYFDPSRVQIDGKVSIDGAPIAFPGLSSWTDNGDMHTATLNFTGDGDYEFTVKAVDQAGNESQLFNVPKFTIDQTIPTITFGGVEENAAYNEVVEPTVTFEDINYDVENVNITLVGANHGTVNFANGASDSGNGQTISFGDFAHDKEVDDIYTLTANITDMAGNSFEDSITFSVNRFGSNYVLDDGVKEINGKFIQEPIDIVFTETNVNSLNTGHSKLVVSTNGNPRTLNLGSDYQIAQSGGVGTWSQYVYTIDKSVFAADGSYIVSVYSEDEAGNINENDADDKNAEITFGVDGTNPEVVLLNLEDKGSYNDTSYTAKVSATDNLVLDSVSVSVDGNIVETQANGDEYSFDIPSKLSKQDVVIVAMDAAGNTREIDVNNVMVTTNMFARIINNTLLIGGIASGAVVLTGGIVGISFYRKRRIVK